MLITVDGSEDSNEWTFLKKGYMNVSSNEIIGEYDFFFSYMFSYLHHLYIVFIYADVEKYVVQGLQGQVYQAEAKCTEHLLLAKYTLFYTVW